jgi:hypothetical protein
VIFFRDQDLTLEQHRQVLRRAAHSSERARTPGAS